MFTKLMDLSFLIKRTVSGVRFALKWFMPNFLPDSSGAMSLSNILMSRKFSFVDQKMLQNFLTQIDISPQGVFAIIALLK